MHNVNLSITGRKGLVLTDSLKQIATKRLLSLLKYAKGIQSIDLVLEARDTTVPDDTDKATIHVQLANRRCRMLPCCSKKSDMYAAIDEAVKLLGASLRRRIRRARIRKKNRATKRRQNNCQ